MRFNLHGGVVLDGELGGAAGARPSSINIGARSCEHVHKSTFSFQNKFTNVFSAQNFSVLIAADSGLILDVGATDYFLGYFFQFDAVI